MKSEFHKIRILFIIIIIAAPIFLQTFFHTVAADIVKDDVFIRSIMDKDNYKGGVAVGLINARCDEVWAILTDYNSSAEYMPNIKESRVVQRNGNAVLVRNIVSAVLFDVEIIFEMTEDAQNKKLSWKQYRGPFIVNNGFWILERCGSEMTKATYYSEIDHPKLPNWAKKSLIENSIPKCYKAIRERLFTLKNR